MTPSKSYLKTHAPLSWRELPWGEYYLAAIEEELQPWWPKFFGFHLLKIGHLSAEIASDQCSISHQVSVVERGYDAQVIASPYQLPFAEKSVDVCLLLHTLAYGKDPHRILREVDRILTDNGWLVTTNFNPLSLLGVGKLLPLLCHREPYVSRMFTRIRILDWLHLLNYQVMYQSHFHVLPWHKKGGGSTMNTHFTALGCISLTIARKRILPLTLIPIKFATRKPCFNCTVGMTKNYSLPTPI